MAGNPEKWGTPGTQTPAWERNLLLMWVHFQLPLGLIPSSSIRWPNYNDHCPSRNSGKKVPNCTRRKAFSARIQIQNQKLSEEPAR